jgi:hypothetical protein
LRVVTRNFFSVNFPGLFFQFTSISFIILILVFHTQLLDAKCNRNNFTIEYKNDCFGLIKLFLLIKDKLFIIVQELRVEKSDFKVKTANLNVNDAFKKFMILIKNSIQNNSDF